MKMMNNAPEHIWAQYRKPSVKTLRDKLCGMLQKRKIKNASKVAASGISEDVSEADQFLDEFLLEKQSVETDRKRKRADDDVKESKLVATRENIRALVTSHITPMLRDSSSDTSVSSKSRRVVGKRKREESKRELE